MRIRPFGACAALLSATLLGVSGCRQQTALGEANSLIIIVPDSVWNQVEEETRAVLEPTIFTSRDEKQYEVSAVDPGHQRVADLMLFRNVLVFGTDDDPLLIEAAAAADQDLAALEPGRVFQARDVWARGQTVTATLLRRGRETESWIDALPSVLNAVDMTYREHVLQRMFATSTDTALATDLGRRFGFSLYVPQVYDWVVRDLGGGDSLVIVRNDNPDPSELIRSVLVAWRPGVDSLTRELALEWRAEIDATHYNVPQRIDDTNSSVVSFQWQGYPALEVTGVWQDEAGGFPAAGPFIVWLVDCPARTYFVDAWLYSPNRPKYEYVLQLQEILGSFRCIMTGE
ncbi:DUF4837 family protein [Candidatus Palauibacter sp.]|uniref:DUF4837 family protein n=1 Tax=Candidatus Palauibacter sp. TaxID=3101350 RepID=UPI003AF1FEB5